MSERTFRILLIVIALIGLAITIAHAVYIVNAYQHSSIIQLVAKELWL